MSDESSFTLFPTSGRVYVRTSPKEAYNPECLVPTENMEPDLWWFRPQYVVFCWSPTSSEWLNYCQWLRDHFRLPGASCGPGVVS